MVRDGGEVGTRFPGDVSDGRAVEPPGREEAPSGTDERHPGLGASLERCFGGGVGHGPVGDESFKRSYE